jgi:hypothetical protein
LTAIAQKEAASDFYGLPEQFLNRIRLLRKSNQSNPRINRTWATGDENQTVGRPFPRAAAGQGGIINTFAKLKVSHVLHIRKTR